MIPTYMSRLFGPNWRTTLIGMLTAFFGFVVFDPELFPHWLAQFAKFAMTGGMAAIGFFTKDAMNHEPTLPAGSTITKETSSVTNVTTPKAGA